MLDGQMRYPLEKPGKVQAGDNQHHGEEQHEGREVDAGDGLRGRKNTEDKHEHRANHRHRGRSIFVPGRRPTANTR